LGISAIGNLATAFGGVGGLTSAVKGAGSALVGFASAHPIIAVAVAIGTALLAAYASNFLGFKDFIDGTVVPGIIGAWNWMCTEIPKAAGNAWNAVVSGVQSFAGWLGDLWDTFTKEGLFGVWEKVLHDIGKAWEGFCSWLGGAWEGFTSWIGGVWDSFIGWLGGVWEGFTSWLGGVWEGFKSWAAGVAAGLLSGLQATGADIAEFFSGLWNSIAEGFTGLIGDALEWGKNLIGSFIDGINSAVGAVGDALSNVGGTIADFLGIGSPAKKGPLHELMKWGPNLVKSYAEGIAAEMPTLESAAKKLAGVFAGVPRSFSVGISMGTLPAGGVTKSVTIGSMSIYVTNPGASAEEIAEEIYRKIQRLM